MNDNEKEKYTTRTGIKCCNTRCITICDNVPEHWDSIIDIAKSSYHFYAYIFHDKDDGVEKHLHILCLDKGGTTFKAHCERFSSVISANFVLKVKSPRAMARYLIHKDSQDKHQYLPSDVVTNQPDKYAEYISDHVSDVVQEFNDFSLLFSGQLSVPDYLEKYRAEFSSMPFYQKQALFHRILTSSYYNLHYPSSTSNSSREMIVNRSGKNIIIK